jgi:hypothetical protein
VLGVENPNAFWISQFQDGAGFEGAIQRTALTFAFLAYEYGHYWKRHPNPQQQQLLDDTLAIYSRSLSAWLDGPLGHVLAKGEWLKLIKKQLVQAPEPTPEWPNLFRRLEASGAGPWEIFVKSHADMAFAAEIKPAFHQIRNAITV